MASAPTQTFSDLCTEAQSGDTAGRFVQLNLSSGAAAITYGYTEGALIAPVHGRHVRFRAATGALSFDVRTWTALRFQGRITPKGLVGRLQSARSARPQFVRLTRVPGLADRLPPCSPRPQPGGAGR